MSLTEEVRDDSLKSQSPPLNTRENAVGEWEGESLRIEDIRDRLNFPDDRCLEDFMQWCLRHPQRINSYSYWSSASPTRHDLEVLIPDGGIAFHQQLIALMQSRLRIVQSPYCEKPADHQQLIRAIVAYRQSLAAKAVEFQRRVADGSYPDKSDPLFSLNGLTVEADGSEHDLLANYREVVDGWLPNLSVYSQSFVNYSSTESLNKHYFWKRDGKEHNIKPEHHRIYLNPNPDRALEIAAWLMDYSEDPDHPLALQMKIYNRAIEAGRARLPSIRSEGIVVYTYEEHTNAVLRAIQICHAEHYSAFARRTVSKLAVPVAEGVAVASNEGLDDDRLSSQPLSFLGHRARIFDEAWKIFQCYREAYYAATITPQELATFKQCLISTLSEHGVDTSNIAFPRRDAASYQSMWHQSSSVIL